MHHQGQFSTETGCRDAYRHLFLPGTNGKKADKKA